ncbi:MAG TPA: DTW domain-containing protein [Stellaceae bacterium]|nr:DTW domain-containing protein [Stellaceae bacterium]
MASDQDIALAAAPEIASPADNRLFVLILQHPQEKKEPLSTAVATAAALRRAKLAIGLSWPNLARPLGRDADPRRWAVLYLGSARPRAFTGAGEVLLLGDDGEVLRDPASVLRALDGLIVIDGTWSQAKTLWWRNPWLLKLHRLVLNPARPARLGRFRREPRREALSTIEATALVLRQIEAKPDAADALDAALDRLLANAGPPLAARRRRRAKRPI